MAAGGSSFAAAFLLGLLLASICLQLDARGARKEAPKQEEEQRGEAVNGGGFVMEDERRDVAFLYGRGGTEDWSRFRDEVEDDYIRNVDESVLPDENMDSTKDPCHNVKCSRHKLCVAHHSQRAVCISRKKLQQRVQEAELPGAGVTTCPPCRPSASGPVCGSDGHNYASQCKLQQQACLTGKVLNVMCAGFCPCVPSVAPVKHERCTPQELGDLGERLKDWFQLLHGNAKTNKSGKLAARTTSALDKSLLNSCKDSIGWMFLKLDVDGDLRLEPSELAAVNLDKYEVCIRPFFNSCDSYKDGKVSVAEWCLCFWREKPPCLAELQKIQMQNVAPQKTGTYIPICDEDGFYRKLQCEQRTGECWCVEQQGGTELTGTRIRGNPDCDEDLEYSGHYGSGVGWEDEEEKELEEEEEDEDQEEEEEVDDGGYIW